MSDQLNHSARLTRITADLDSTVCALKVLAYLINNSAHIELSSNHKLAREEVIYGVAGLLTALAKDLEGNSINISAINDQLSSEGARP